MDAPHSIETLAYAAGLFDGEGCVTISLTRPKMQTNRRLTPRYDLQTKISNTHRPILEWMHDNFGGVIITHYPRSKNRDASNWRQAWIWQIKCYPAQKVLELLLPYLKIKREQAILAIEFQQFSQSHSLQSYANRTREAFERLESYRQQVHMLNRPQIPLEGIDEWLEGWIRA